MTVTHLAITFAVLSAVCLTLASFINRNEEYNIALRAEYRGPDDPEIPKAARSWHTQ